MTVAVDHRARTKWWSGAAALLASAVLIGSACSDDSSGEDAAPVNFSQPGPYAVGVADFEVGGKQIAVFYPADTEPGTTGNGAEPYSYSGEELFGAELASLLPGAFGEPQVVDGAFRDLPASADAPFPVLLSSHGAGGYYRFSGQHNAAVASWGVVVVAVDHPQRGTLAAFSGETDPTDSDVDDLGAALDFVAEPSGPGTTVLDGLVNADQVAVEGHSAGGAAAGLFAADPRVDTWIGMAPAPPVDAETAMAEGGSEDFDVAAYYAENDPPDKPSMLLAADDDVAISLDEVESLYDWLPPPRRLAVVENSGHGVFVDICLPVQQEGGLAEAVRRLGVDPDDIFLVRLGEDGCLAEDTPAEDVFALVDHLTVAQLRWVFDIDEAEAAVSLERSYLDEEFPGLLQDYQAEE